MNKKFNVYFMYAIVFLQGFIFYGPISVIYRQSRGLSMSSMFLIESISWILIIILEIPWGWFADRFGYKKTLVISNFLFFVSKIVFYKADSFGLFFLERALLSLSLAGLSGCDISLIYLSIEEKDGEKVFGRYNAFTTGGFLIASLMSSFLIKESLDSTAFWTIIPYGVAFILTLFLKDIKEEEEERPNLKRSFFTAFKNKKIIPLVLSMALISEVVQAVSVFLNQTQYIRSGIDIRFFGVLTAVMQIVRLNSAKAHRLTSVIGKNKSLEVLYILVGLSCAALIVSSNAFVTVLAIALVCAGEALAGPIVLNIENESIKTDDRATLLSIYSMLGNLLAVGTNIIVGGAADISASFAFIVCTLMSLSAYILILIYNKRSLSDEVEALEIIK
ncbi:MFS transporter [Clostridium polynesiense]|uniref:MFS transporter n=1 Tax=Clostridium polynesiense TaxID=1325933 RepID=UPI00058F1CEB|nr:MFS transporter [Clostridium polynesiense]